MTKGYKWNPEKLKNHKGTLGFHHSEESKKKISEHNAKIWLGKKLPKETIEKIRQDNLKNPRRYWLGKKRSEETRKKISERQKGRPHHSEEGKKRISDSTRMEKNPSWLGGISFEPYGFGFNKEVKEKIRRRDGHRCQECFRHQDELFTSTGRKYRLLIHHIDYDKRNNEDNNLISLCRNCHLQTNWKRNDWTEYFTEKINIYG